MVDVSTYFDALLGHADTGFSNVTPAIKWQISPVPGKIDLSATLGAGLPTGTKAIAGPGAQPYLEFPWSWELSDGWSVNGMLTNFVAPAAYVNRLSTETTFVIEREIGKNTSCSSNMSAIINSMAAPAISSTPAGAIASPTPRRSISTSASTATRRPISLASAIRSDLITCSDGIFGSSKLGWRVRTCNVGRSFGSKSRQSPPEQHRHAAVDSLKVLDPNVWTRRALQEKAVRLGCTVLHQCIRPRIGAHAPDHHGNPRASDLINGHASKGSWGHQFSGALERPFLHLVCFSRRPR